MQETRVQFLGREDPLEKEMATHSSILAWEIPSTEEPGGLQSTGWQKDSDMTEWLSISLPVRQASDPKPDQDNIDSFILSFNQ